MIKNLKNIDLLMLSLMILSLPSLEAPKNIFLIGYLLARILLEIYQATQGIKQWSSWDSLFLMIVFSGFLTTLFPGIQNAEEWRGYGVFLTAILTGWFLSRAYYTQEIYHGLFKLLILGTIPPLVFGLYEYFIAHSKTDMQLHSVGHVNHSAIYLVIIFGASLGWLISQSNFQKKLGSKWRLILLSFLCILLFIALIIGQSRGALIIAIILSFFLLFLLAKHSKIKIICGAVFIFMLLIAITFKAGVIQKQIDRQQKNNVLSYRNLVWNVSLEASNFSPLLGIGMSNWHFITLDQLKRSLEARGGLFNGKDYYLAGHSHSLYLTALVERGWVGLLITFTLMIAWMKQLIHTSEWAKKSSQSICLWAGSLSAWFATFGIGLVNTTFHHEHGILACLFLGLYLSYTNLYLKK